MAPAKITRGTGDVMGTYEAVLATTRKTPWLKGKLVPVVSDGFEKAIADLGGRLDRIDVFEDHLKIRFTVRGDIKRPPQGFIMSAKKTVAETLRDEFGDEFKAYRISLGFFDNKVLLRSCGNGVSESDVERFMADINIGRNGRKSRDLKR